jgi:outer membrane protein assembly factor BamD
MRFRKKFCNILQLLIISALFCTACVEKVVDPHDPAAAFARARESYDDEMYEIAIQKLGEFKSRFPYSKHAPEAELLMADAQYQLGRYSEAASSYEQFVRLHPRHEKADFAQFRVGESYWAEAPDSIDREQDYTIKAIAEWDKLVKNYPQSSHLNEAKDFLLQGRRRVAEHYEFIARFYCKQEIYHACAYRYLQLAEQYPQFKDLTKTAYGKAALAFEEMSKIKSKDEQSDANIYFKSMSSNELKQRADELKKKADSIAL